MTGGGLCVREQDSSDSKEDSEAESGVEDAQPTLADSNAATAACRRASATSSKEAAKAQPRPSRSCRVQRENVAPMASRH